MSDLLKKGTQPKRSTSQIIKEVDGEDEGLVVPEADGGSPLPLDDVADEHGRIATRQELPEKLRQDEKV